MKEYSYASQNPDDILLGLQLKEGSKQPVLRFGASFGDFAQCLQTTMALSGIDGAHVSIHASDRDSAKKEIKGSVPNTALMTFLDVLKAHDLPLQEAEKIQDDFLETISFAEALSQLKTKARREVAAFETLDAVTVESLSPVIENLETFFAQLTPSIQGMAPGISLPARTVSQAIDGALRDALKEKFTPGYGETLAVGKDKTEVKIYKTSDDPSRDHQTIQTHIIDALRGARQLRDNDRSIV